MSYTSRKGYDFSLTDRILAAAVEVHRTLGPGFQEVVYQAALELEMKALSLSYAREEPIPVYYKGQKIDSRRIDFLVGDCVVELKAKEAFERRDFVQTLSYLKASGYELALLLNFGAEKLEIKRLVKTQRYDQL